MHRSSLSQISYKGEQPKEARRALVEGRVQLKALHQVGVGPAQQFILRVLWEFDVQCQCSQVTLSTPLLWLWGGASVVHALS